MICSAPACGQKVKARGLCASHYRRAWKLGDLPAIAQRACSVEGCSRPHYAKSLCNTHYVYNREHGTPVPPKREVKYCTVAACKKAVLAKGLCSTHYTRVRTAGSTDNPRRFTLRFWSRVAKADGCWLWLGGKDQDGYGQISLGPRSSAKNLRTHRVSWELHNGEIPAGMHVLHKCDTPSCVRPDHLFLGTDADNTRDKVNKGRQATGLRNGKHTRPDRTPRGNDHWARRKKLAASLDGRIAIDGCECYTEAILGSRSAA